MFQRKTKSYDHRKQISRKLLGMIGVGAVVIAGLAGAIWAPPSHAVEGFPVIDSGSGTAGQINPNWDIATSNTAVGGSYTSDGWVRLTDNNTNEITNMLNKTAFSSTSGFIAEFDYRVAGGSGLGIGDGMSFYLTDGTVGVSEGGAGLGLAYSSSNAPHPQGVVGGVVGIGFDAWGDYGNSFSENGCSRGGLGTTGTPNSIGIRGAGSDGCSTADYPLLGGRVWANPGGYPIATSATGTADPATIADSQYRHVRITVTPPASGATAPTLDLAMSAPVAKDEAFGDLIPVITSQELDQAMPDTLKLGFGASTGGATCFADLRNISISALADLSISGTWNTTQPSAGYLPGSTIGFTLSARDLGPSSVQTTQVSAMPMLVADLSALPIGATPTLTPIGDGTTGDTVDPQFTNGLAMASWWSEVSTSSLAGLTVSATLDANAPAGDYSFDSVIPTDFTNYTLDPTSSFVTPGKGASDPNLANNTVTLDFTVAQVPAMSWSGTPSATLDGAPFAVGSEVTFTFPYTNTGNTPITVTATPAGFTGHGTPPTLTCDSTPVDLGASGTCTGTYTLVLADINQGGVALEATGTATASGGATASSGLSTTASLQAIPATGLALTKTATAPSDFAVGQNVEYSFEVENTGDATISALEIDDSEGFGGAGVAPDATCPETSLDPGESMTCTASYPLILEDVNDEGFSNNATVGGTALAGTAASFPVSSASAGASVSGVPILGLTLTKTAALASGASFIEGGQVNYVFHLTNSGEATLTLDPTTLVTEEVFSGTGTPPTIDCSGAAATINPGHSTSCTASYALTQDDVNATHVDNGATGQAIFDSTVVNAPLSSATLTGTPTKSMTITASGEAPSTWASGNSAPLTVTIINSGQVTITDPEVVLSGFTGSAPTVTCPDLPDGLAPTQSVECTAAYTLTLADANAASVTFDANATAQTESLGEVTSNQTSATFTGVPVSSLNLVKTATDPTDFLPGEKIVYDFLIFNNGADTIDTITIVDDGPENATGAWVAPTGCDDTLDPGGETTCSGSYTLTQDDVNQGVVSNSAFASGDNAQGLTIKSGTSIATSGPDANGIGGDHRGAISISLASGTLPAPISVGAPVPFTATVTNTGPVTLNSLMASVVGLTEGTGPGQYQIDCGTPGDIAPAASVECEITYYLSANDVETGQASITATGQARSTLGIATATQNSPLTTVTFEIPGGIDAQGSAALASGAPYQAGSLVDYQIVVSNTGETTLEDIDLAVVDFTGTGTPSPVFTCPDTSLVAGGQMTCTATYTLTQADVDNAFSATPGPLDLSAEVSANTGDPSNAQSQVVRAGPLEELLGGQPTATVNATGSAPTVAAADFKAGNTVTFSFNVVNSGAVSLTEITPVVDHVSGDGAVGAVVCVPDPDQLEPGASLACSVTYTLTQADVDSGTVLMGLDVSGTYGSDKLAIGGASEVLNVEPLGSVELTKAVSGPSNEDFLAGAELSYTFTVTNTGNATLSEIALSETSFSGTGTAPVIACPEDSTTLAPAAQLICTASYVLTQADVDALSVTNQAEVSATYFAGQKTATDQASAVFSAVASESISLVQTVTSLTDPQPGDQLQFTYTITNTGNLTLNNWELAVGTFTGSGTLSGPNCPSTPTSLAPGQSVECSATYAITETDLQNGSVSSTATATADTSEGTVSDASTVVSTLQASGGIALVKSAAMSPGAQFAAGGEVTFEFEVTNTGTLDITGATITEDSSFTGTGALVLDGCTVPDPLGWGQSYTCDATYLLTQADVNAGGVTNTATVAGSFIHDGQPVAATDDSTVSLKGVGKSEILLEKSVVGPAAGEFLPGAGVTYGFVVTNTGVTTLTDIEVTETDFSGTGSLGEVTCDSTGPLEPGEDTSCQATYQVTQGDVDAEVLTNEATVSASTLDGAVTVTDSSQATLAPTGIVSSIAITDEATTTDGSKLVEGSSVEFKLVITNDGVTTLEGTAVASSVAAGSGTATQTRTGGTAVTPQCDSVPVDFQPGDSFECSVTYVLTTADIAAGAITNTATATATNAVGTEVSDTASAEVSGLQVPKPPVTETVPPPLSITGASQWAGLIAALLLPAGLLLVLRRRSQDGSRP